MICSSLPMLPKKQRRKNCFFLFWLTEANQKARSEASLQNIFSSYL